VYDLEPGDGSTPAMHLRFRSIDEAEPGAKWKAHLEEAWPAYHRWFLREGESKRPSYLRSSRMLAQYMPELVPLWERLTALGGGGDHVARLLSLYRPTPYLAGCSQAVWSRPDGAEPLLVRNYDYHPALCEGTLLLTAWHGTKVIAMSDCLWGVLDGLNEHGLAVSLAFGGRPDVGEGFGVPLVLRYVLEFSRTTEDAVRVLQRVPSHMAYNVSVLDASGAHATVEVGPEHAAVVSHDRVATNHQRHDLWPAHAVRTATEERKQVLEQRLDDAGETRAGFIDGFLEAPLFGTDYAHALGTLYTATYAPAGRWMELRWRDHAWRRSFAAFEEEELLVAYGPDGSSPVPGPAASSTAALG